MLEQHYVRPATLDRIRSSWIGPVVEQYAKWLAERKYAQGTIGQRVPILLRFADFARKRGVIQVEDLPALVEPFIESCLAHRHWYKPPSADARQEAALMIRGPVQQTLRLVVPGYTKGGRHRKPENAFMEQAPDFLDYLRRERGLTEVTVVHYTRYLRRLATYLKSIKLKSLKDLSAPILSAFITQGTQRVARKDMIACCACTRVFLRYLHRERIIAKDLSRAIEHPRRYRLANIPRSITWEEVRQVLESVDRRTALGKRDYAILLLLVTYGLRAREVAALTLDDIEWRNERLRVPFRKAAHSTAYPLSPIVGQAIIDYLKGGRPQTSERKIFFRTVAPEGPIHPALVASRASWYMKKAGIRVPLPGSHTLRHTCVQRLVDADFSLKAIGDYVGHRDPSSTEIYGKVAIEALREVASGDGEAIV